MEARERPAPALRRPQAGIEAAGARCDGRDEKIAAAIALWRGCDDATRWQRRPRTFDSPQAALKATAEFYRKSLWSHAQERVEIWIEKDALAGVIFDVTAAYDVPLMTTRGYPSLSFLAGAAEEIAEDAKPTFVYHLGDYDPSGQDAARVTEKRLRELAPDAEIHFECLAVTPSQIVEFGLPTRPTKTSDSRAKNFGPVSVELDAIPADWLRLIVREAIEYHLPARQLEIMKVAEASERKWLDDLASRVAERRGARE